MAHFKHLVDLSHHMIVHRNAPAPHHRQKKNLIAQRFKSRDARFVAKKNSTIV
jgi:hypothetical protein